MTPADERRLQQAAAALTAHYYDKDVRDRLLADGVGVEESFALLDAAAASIGGPASSQDPEQWLAGVTTDQPGLERSVVVFRALADVTGVPPEQWASTFALAASPEAAPSPGRSRGPNSPY